MNPRNTSLALLALVFGFFFPGVVGILLAYAIWQELDAIRHHLTEES